MPDPVPFVDLKAQHQPLREQFLGAITEVLDSGAFCLGPAVERFEQAWAAYCGARHAVAVQSGTAALQAALIAAGVGRGDEVVTAANTFVATVGAIHFVGARPVLVDMDPASYNLDPGRLEAAITERTRAIIPVHLYGQMADMDPILEIAAARGIPVIEDASQAHGARYKGKGAGTMGVAGCFSFYPGKNLGALGEGGAVVTDDDEAALTMRRFRNHGGVARYEHKIPGLNYRMHGFQGAALNVKLPHLDGWNERRREVARRYDAALAGTPLVLPRELPERRHIYHLYVVQVDDRDGFMAYLGEHGVASGIHYRQPCHLLEAYAHLGYGPGDFPAAEAASDRIVSLPMFPAMTDAQVDRVVEVIQGYFAARGGQ